MMQRFRSQSAVVVIALGSNLRGAYRSRQALLEAAVARLPALGGRVLARSRWWCSAAWPDPSDPAYLNGVVLVETRLDPAATLRTLQALEARFRRRRERRNAPRTIDLDLIAHGRKVIRGPRLILPHPRARDRLFVMGPLAEIAPSWRHPVTGERADALAARARVGADARPSGLTWPQRQAFRAGPRASRRGSSQGS